MALFRETISCRACATRVTLAAEQTTDSPAELRTLISVACPICDRELALSLPSEIDAAALELVGFECKQEP